MMGTRYEICRLTTARERMALKAVVEPMLIIPSRMRRNVTTMMEIVGISRRLSTLAMYCEKGSPDVSVSKVLM